MASGHGLIRAVVVGYTEDGFVHIQANAEFKPADVYMLLDRAKRIVLDQDSADPITGDDEDDDAG